MRIELPPIELDLSCDVDKAFAEWYSYNDALTKQVMLMGYCTLVHGAGAYYSANCDRTVKTAIEALQAQVRGLQQEKTQLRERIDDVVADGVRVATASHERARTQWDEERSRMESDFARRVSDLEHKLENSAAEAKAALEMQYRYDTQACSLQHASEVALLRAELTSQCERYRALYDEVKTRLDGYTEGMYKRQIDDLQCALESQRKMTDMLRKTNAGKGALGEGMLADYFRSHFTDWNIVDKSGCKHSGDIWIQRADERILIVESKYKEVITRGDVDKFLTDTDYVVSTRGDLLGALFISLKTRNIPGKGDMHMEFRNGRPLLYVGMVGEHDLDNTFLKQCAALVIAIGDYQVRMEHRDADVSKTMERVRPLLRNIERIRIALDNVKTAHKTVVDNVGAMQDDIACMFTIIHEVLVANGINTCLTPTKPKRKPRKPAASNAETLTAQANIH